MLTRVWRLAAAALVGVGSLASAEACTDPLDPSTFGIVDARIEDDLRYPVGSASIVRGRVTSSFVVSVRRVDCGWIDLGAPVLTDVVVGDTANYALHNPQAVPAGEYDAIRLRLTDLEVELSQVTGSDLFAWSVAGVWQLEWTFASAVPVATDETVFFAIDLNVDQWATWSSSATVQPPSTPADVLLLLEQHVTHRVKGFN